MALVSDILLRITGTSDDARQALREVAAEVAVFNQIDAEATLNANPKPALDKIAEIDAALSLIGQRKVSATVKVDIDDARTRLRLLKAELEHALRGGAGARPVAKIASDIAAVGAKTAELGTELGSLGAKGGAALAQIGGAVGGGLSSLLTSVASGIVTIMASVGLLAVAAAVLVPVIVALAGTFLALAASLGAAAAGFGALLTAGLFAALPVIGVAIFAIVRLVGAVKALKDAEKNRTTTARQLRDAEEAHSDAIRNKKEAVENLAKAQVDGAKAERDALIGLRDAQLSLAEAKLGIQDADLGLDIAKKKLDDLKDAAKDAGPAFGDLLKKFTDVDVDTDKSQIEKLVKKVGALPGGTDQQLEIRGALLDVAHAQLAVKEAKQRDIHATNDLSDAVKRNNEFTRDGIRAYEPYINALRQVEAADRAVRNATEHTSDIRIKANEAAKKYSETELSTGRAIIKIFESIKKVMQPLSSPVTKGILGFFQGVEKLATNPRVKTGLGGIGEAIGAVVAGFGDLLASDEVGDLFADITEDAADLTKILGGGVFQDLFVIFLRIARAAAPALIDLFESFARFLSRLRRGTDNADDLRRGVNGVVRSFRLWLGLARQLARVVLNFFRGGKDEGDSLVRTLTRIVKRFADFLGTDEGQAKVRRFLRKSVEDTKDFLQTLRDIYKVFKTMVDIVELLGAAISKTFKAIKDSVFGKLVQGLAGAAGSAAGGDGPLDILKSLVRPNRGRSHGGLVDGPGGMGDNVLQPLEGGEFVLKRSVVASIGLPALNAINSTGHMRSASPAAASVGGMTIAHQEVILPAAPGHGQMGDPKAQAAEFAKEMRRRGAGR